MWFLSSKHITRRRMMHTTLSLKLLYCCSPAFGTTRAAVEFANLLLFVPPLLCICCPPLATQQTGRALCTTDRRRVATRIVLNSLKKPGMLAVAPMDAGRPWGLLSAEGSMMDTVRVSKHSRAEHRLQGRGWTIHMKCSTSTAKYCMLASTNP